MEFKQSQLDNGLTIVTEVNPSAASMAAGFFVRTGSRDETPAEAGVSHFLEHMMFKGTERRSPEDVNREFDELGARYNASTSEENTIYYGAVLPEHQERVLDLLCDMLRPSLRQQDFDMEKNVILEEIALYADRPQFRVYEKLMATHFASHPLGNSILGTGETISDLTRDQMLDYFRRRYSPGNITVVGVGNLDFDAFAAKVEAMCSHWEPCDVGRDLPEPARDGGGTSVVTDSKVTRAHVGLMSPGPSAQDERRYAAELAGAIVGDHTGSRLYYALVEPAIADEASLQYDPFDGTGAFLGFISADADRAAGALKIAREQIAGFVDEGPTDAELRAAKNKIASVATTRGELPMGRLVSVGADWVYRRQYVPLAEDIERLFAVTRDDVAAVARDFDMSALTVLGLGPMEAL